MNQNLDPTKDNFNNEELEIDKALRPLSFSDFNGQKQVIDNLKIFVQAANERSEALDHTLLHGPPGLGKTTLAHILAEELATLSFGIKNLKYPNSYSILKSINSLYLVVLNQNFSSLNFDFNSLLSVLSIGLNHLSS